MLQRSRLAFGPGADDVKHLGYHYALVRLEADDDDVMCNEPGRMMALGGAKAPALFVFASEPFPGMRDDVGAQKRFLVEAYRGRSWPVPELIAQYEAKYCGYASVSHKFNAGRLLAPSTRLGIRARNLLVSAMAASGPLMKLVDRPASKFKLKDYGGKACADRSNRTKALSGKLWTKARRPSLTAKGLMQHV